MEEIQQNLKLSPQELLDKVRKERERAQKEAEKQPMLSSSAHNQSLADKEKARREARREMTKEERRAVKEELNLL